MDFKKCEQQSAYFFKKKQKPKKETGKTGYCVNSPLSSQNLLFELNLQLNFDLICINNLTKIFETAKFKLRIFVKMKHVHKADSEVEINFFNDLPVEQVISNVNLPEKVLTCPKTKKVQ